MKCERCKEPVSTMVALPKRHNALGEITSFMNLCIKCAKEVIHERENRKMSKMSKSEHGQSRPRKEPNEVRGLRPMVRRAKGVKNGEKNIKRTEGRKKKNAGKPNRFRIGLPVKVRAKRRNKLRNDD